MHSWCCSCAAPPYTITVLLDHQVGMEHQMSSPRDMVVLDGTSIPFSHETGSPPKRITTWFRLHAKCSCLLAPDASGGYFNRPNVDRRAVAFGNALPTKLTQQARSRRTEALALRLSGHLNYKRKIVCWVSCSMILASM